MDWTVPDWGSMKMPTLFQGLLPSVLLRHLNKTGDPLTRVIHACHLNFRRMRNNIFIMISVLLALSAASCKKSFIELSPQDQASSATFYQTEAQFRQALIAAYTPLRDLLTNDFYTAEMRSDNTHYQYYRSNRGTAYVYRENIADFTDQAIDDYSNAVYFHPYRGISRA